MTALPSSWRLPLPPVEPRLIPDRNPGRDLAKIGADKRRAKRIALHDDLRARLGLAAHVWAHKA